MPRIAYERKKFAPATINVIAQAQEILNEYEAAGYDLTLRQLYYQFVARDLIANKQTEYKRLGSIINDARMAGYIDWDSITDRTRNLRSLAAWNSPSDLVEAAADQYRRKLWETQSHYVEVWIEKDALVGVIERPCNEWRVPYFSCRGYVSQSEMWGAAQRIGRKVGQGKKVLILHLGDHDHDPSGIDMTRDITDRLSWFLLNDVFNGRIRGMSGMSEANTRATVREQFEVRRIALTSEQIEQYGPPPNPAKLSDSRARDYVARFGYESWELDALDPTTMGDLIDDHVNDVIDSGPWASATSREASEKATLTAISNRWDDVEDFIEGEDD